jgi:hypothetical protein
MGHAFCNAAAEGVYEPSEVEHLTEWNCAEVEIEPRNENVVISGEKMFSEQKEIVNKLAFVDGYAFDALANFLFNIGDGFKDRPRVVGLEFERIHFCVTVGIATLDNSWTTLCVVAGLENEHVLLSILAPHIGAAQKLGGLVASHRPQ